MTPDGPTGPFVVVGAGGHGREVLDLVEDGGWRDRFLGFVDDGPLTPLAIDRLERRSAAVIGDVAWLADAGHDHVVGIGTSAARRAVVAALGGSAGKAVTICHPTASLGSVVTLGEGVVVGAGATITTNVTLGRHTHVNVGCAVQHDSTLGDFVTLSPGVFVNGDVVIGSDVFVGTGAVITRGCTVGDGATVGAGAVVLSDVAPGRTVLGVPARPR